MLNPCSSVVTVVNGNKQTLQQEVLSENLEPKYKEILQNIVKSKNSNGSGSNGSNNNMSNPLTNIIGSGIKSFKIFLNLFSNQLVNYSHLPAIG